MIQKFLLTKSRRTLWNKLSRQLFLKSTLTIKLSTSLTQLVGLLSVAHKGMLYAAMVLAGACADLMESPALLEQARSEFNITAAEGYDCPIGPEVTPTQG